MKLLYTMIIALVIALNGFSAQQARAVDASKPTEKMVQLKICLPPAIYTGTRIDFGPGVEPLSKAARPLIMVPAGLSNLAMQAKIITSDKKVSAAKLNMINDGVKENSEEATLSLHKGPQWVELDFEKPIEIYAVVVWHGIDRENVCKDVIVQAGDDADMVENVRTLFNNDQDNSLGLGVGTDREYIETCEGKLLETKGLKARCLRFYSSKSSDTSVNQYAEIEVYGRPVQ